MKKRWTERDESKKKKGKIFTRIRWHQKNWIKQKCDMKYRKFILYLTSAFLLYTERYTLEVYYCYKKKKLITWHFFYKCMLTDKTHIQHSLNTHGTSSSSSIGSLSAWILSMAVECATSFCRLIDLLRLSLAASEVSESPDGADCCCWSAAEWRSYGREEIACITTSNYTPRKWKQDKNIILNFNFINHAIEP